MIEMAIFAHFKKLPESIKRMSIGISNEVYEVSVDCKVVIIRLSKHNRFLMGTRDHTPQFKALGIPVADILAEDYSQTLIPLSYQILTKIEGEDLGLVIETLSDHELKALAKEIALIFNKVRMIPATHEFGIVWGGGDNELSASWTERMRIWVQDCKERGHKTGVMDAEMELVLDKLYEQYEAYFSSIKPITYYGDICSKNVMIHKKVFSGLVDLDGLTQGDPLEAVGRINLSWYGTHHGEVYAGAVMDELGLSLEERKIVAMYSLLNQISWACDNGIEYNQNTHDRVDKAQEALDKDVIHKMIQGLFFHHRISRF